MQHGVLVAVDDTNVVRIEDPFWVEALPLQDFSLKYGLTPIFALGSVSDPLSDDGFRVVPRAVGMAGLGRVEQLETTLLGWAMGANPHRSNVLFLVQQLRAARYHLVELVARHLDALEAVSDSARSLRDYLDSNPEAGESLDATVWQFPGFHWARALDGSSFAWPACKVGPLDRVHFEVAAALATAKRALDAIPGIMNSCQWAKGRTYPSSMRRTVNRLRESDEAIPPEIRERLLAEWEEWGAQLGAYRTCSEHFSTLADIGIPNLSYVVSNLGLVGIICVLPDNPSANSPRGFTWNQGIDALDYVSTVYLHTLDLAAFVLQSTTPPPDVLATGYATQTIRGRPPATGGAVAQRTNGSA